MGSSMDIEFFSVETTSGSRELQVGTAAWAQEIASSSYCPCCGDQLRPIAPELSLRLQSQKDRYWGKCARHGNIYTVHDPQDCVYAYGCDASILPCSLVDQCSHRVQS